MLVKDTGSGTEFEPAPAGAHAARCYQVIDLGTQHSEKYDSDYHQVYIGFELPNELFKSKDQDGNETERPFVIGAFYTNSLSEKANLRKDLESWRGRGFSQEELKVFELRKLLGAPTLISIVHKTGGENVRARISGLNKPINGMNTPPLVNAEVYFSFEHFSQKSFDNVSKGLQKIIMRSPEWADAFKTASTDNVHQSVAVDVEADVPY